RHLALPHRPAAHRRVAHARRPEAEPERERDLHEQRNEDGFDHHGGLAECLLRVTWGGWKRFATACAAPPQHLLIVRSVAQRRVSKDGPRAQAAPHASRACPTCALNNADLA